MGAVNGIPDRVSDRSSFYSRAKVREPLRHVILHLLCTAIRSPGPKRASDLADDRVRVAIRFEGSGRRARAAARLSARREGRRHSRSCPQWLAHEATICWHEWTVRGSPSRGARVRWRLERRRCCRRSRSSAPATRARSGSDSCPNRWCSASQPLTGRAEDFVAGSMSAARSNRAAPWAPMTAESDRPTDGRQAVNTATIRSR